METFEKHKKFLKLQYYKDSFFFPLCSLILKASALWADALYKSKCPSVHLSVCPCVCVFTFKVPLKRFFAPTSQSRMSKVFRDSESRIGKKLLTKGVKSPPKKLVFLANFALLSRIFSGIGVSHSYLTVFCPYFPLCPLCLAIATS